MLTIQQIELWLCKILGDAYGSDPSIRYSSFFQAVSQLQEDLLLALERAADEQYRDVKETERMRG